MSRSELDNIDHKVLAIVQVEGRIRLNELAARVSLSAPAVRDRLKRLEDEGYILGYGAHINMQKLNRPISAMVRLYSDMSDCENVAKQVLEVEGVHECLRISGDETAIAIVHARSPADLEQIIARISRLGRTSSNLVLDRRENVIGTR